MCGIFGFNWDEKNLLEDMQKVLQHRGPDSKKFYTDNKISLGNCRLAIIDLKKGEQPIHNEDNSIWINFNGEIYNYKWLRQDLEKKKHRFYTNTDTEVIVHAYEEYRENCLKHLKGMFAFAIYDSERKQLFLARDRVGIKPLYYYTDKHRFIFASEIKAILQCNDVKKEINFEVLNNLFTFRYASGESSILKNVYKLLPGHYLILKDGKIKIKQYWDLKLSPIEGNEDVLMKELDSVLEESIQRHTQSDVPLGVFLSGGLDSSAIIYYLSKTIKEPIKTFTLGFSEAENNEFKFAKIIADKFNTDHKELLIKPSTIEMLPKVIWYLDEPLADPTSIPCYVLAKEASKQVKVVLSGEGSDELFAGYEQYKIMKLAKSYNSHFPNLLQKSMYSFTSRLSKDYFFNKLTNFLKELNDTQNSYIRLLSIFDENEKKELYSEELIKKIESLKPNLNILNSKFQNNGHLLNQMLFFDTKNWLPDDILLKFDKMTMANSIEGRVPFLDDYLIEFSTKLPPDLKLKRLNEKYILKKTLQNKIPKSIIKRKKQRFPLPLDSWFHKGLKNYSQRILDDTCFESSKFFNKNFITKLLDYPKKVSYNSMLKHNSLSRLYYPRQLWTLITFELWYRIFINAEHYEKIIRN